MSKRQIWLDAVERDLLCMALHLARSGCTDTRSGNDTRVERMCKTFVTHRIDDILTKLGCTAETSK